MWWMARGEIELPDHDDWLSVREREQAGSIRFTKRRVEYLTRRWTAKHAIAARLFTHAGEHPGPDHAQLASIEVRNHASGAPWVAIDGAEAGVEVSISDRAGWAICLVGVPSPGPGTGRHAEPLGIDVEIVGPRSDAFVSDYLTHAEQSYVRGHDAREDRDAAANLLWSAKESALKVLRVGLRADTRTIDVRVRPVERADGWGALEMSSIDGDRFHGWWRRDGAFLLTLATRSPVEPPVLLPGSADLAHAEPLHSWMARPLA